MISEKTYRRVKAFDAGGVRSVTLSSPGDVSVGQLIETLQDRLGLLKEDENGPIAYKARTRADGAYLQDGQAVGEALRDEEEIDLFPEIVAG